MPVTVTSKTWQAELKKQGVDKDGGLADALEDYAKVAGKDPKKELNALEQTSAKALAAGKLLKTNKELAKVADTVVIQSKAELRRVREAMKSSEEGGRDMELYSGLKRARTQPMFFALVVRSASVGKMLISKMKVKPSDISEAKKALGGGRVLGGRCLYQNGSHHFILKQEPPATLARLIKRMAKEQAGIIIKPFCRGGDVDGEDESESEEK